MGEILGHDSDLVSVKLDWATKQFAYRTPMKFGGRIVRDVTLVDVTCDATNRAGEKAAGVGSMTMGVAWAWPSRSLDSSQTLEIIVQLASDLVRAGQAAFDHDNLWHIRLIEANVKPINSKLADSLEEAFAGLQTGGHPLGICHSLLPLLDCLAQLIELNLGLSEPIPALARLLAASPLQAALFDAHGKAAGKSSFAMLGPGYLPGDLAEYLGEEFTGERLQRYILPTPADEMPLYHLVGALDPLELNEISSPLSDGLPESLDQWIARDGLTHLKLKLDGANSEWDLTRILHVNRIATASSGDRQVDWQFSLDFNERCQNEEYLLKLLDQLECKSPEAMRRIAYIEQPTHRDLHLHPENTMHRVAARLPVVIDESLVSYESLLLAREQGYSGVAIKACKGHAEALLMAAAAQFHNMFLCVQDLTCVGVSFLHSAALTAHIPGAAAIEGNGRQYCPAANEGWEEKFPGMFDVRGGRLPTAILNGVGLGY